MKLDNPVSWIYFFSQRMALRCLRCCVISTALLWIGCPAQVVLNPGFSFVSTFPADDNSRSIVTNRSFAQPFTAGERTILVQIKCPPITGEWYNRYKRGLCFAKENLWDKAKVELESALRMRAGDMKRARTYGMRFIEYFPHRELGVALFEQGRFEDAIKEIEISLEHSMSDRAKSYLDRARNALNKMEGTDP